MPSDHFESICRLIKASDELGVLNPASDLTGFSGDKLIGLLQRLAAYQAMLNGGCYLEIGVFQGLSLISVARAARSVPVFGVDDFSQFDKDGSNLHLVQERIKTNGVSNATIINTDYEDALEDLSTFLQGRKIGTFFVDGPHDYRSQLICLQLARPYLSESAAIVVDDCNYRHVRLANRDFLVANPEFKLIFESYTPCHPANMNKENESRARRGWWNGVNVIVKDSQGLLDPLYPPTLRDRSLHYNEHSVHSAKYGMLAPEAVALISAAFSLNVVAAAKALLKGLRNRGGWKRELVGRYLSMNTFSEALPHNHFNPVCEGRGGRTQ